MIDQTALERFRVLLLEQQRLLRQVKAAAKDGVKAVELDQARIGRLSRMDALQGQAMSVELERRRDLQLHKIAAALRRISSDEYGYCVRCGSEIALGRLELDPATPLCVECAGDSERASR